MLVNDSVVSSCFPWNRFESKDSFCYTNIKSKFYFLGAIMKYQKFSESEALHEIGEVKQFAQIIVS